MELERPDFEYDEFFYDDEEIVAGEELSPQEAPQAPQEASPEPARPAPQEMQSPEPMPAAAQQAVPKAEQEKPAPSARTQEEPEKKAPPRTDGTAPLRQRGVHVIGKVTKRVTPESIVPHIQKRVDDLVVYMYENGMLTDVPQLPASPGATAPLNARVSPQPGGTYVLVDALTNQMTAVEGSLRVGRDPAFADLIPEGNSTVSAEHAELTVKQNCLVMRDIGPSGNGSSNGTFINGVKIPENSHFSVEVRAGDVLEFSDAKYKVETL